MRQFWRRKYAKIIFSIGLLLNSFDLLEAFEYRAAQFIDIIKKGHTTYTFVIWCTKYFYLSIVHYIIFNFFMFGLE